LVYEANFGSGIFVLVNKACRKELFAVKGHQINLVNWLFLNSTGARENCSTNATAIAVLNLETETETRFTRLKY
jgi:hypothetical protein